MKKLIILYAVLVVFPVSQAKAADIHRIEHSSGQSYISIAGRIVKGDAEKFEKLAHQMIQDEEYIECVRLASSGGSIYEAMQIGEIIRKLGCMTVAPLCYGKKCMSIPDIEHMSQSDKKHIQLIKENCQCSSACFLIWAAGLRREGRILGLHRPYVQKEYYKKLDVTEASEMYGIITQDVTEYLRKNSIPEHIISKMFAHSSSDMYYLTTDEIHELLYQPFFEEYLIAGCGKPLTVDEKVEKVMLQFKESNLQKNNLDLPPEEKERHKALSSRRLAFKACYLEKLREMQSKFLVFAGKPVEITLASDPKTYDLEIDPFEPDVDPWTLN